MTTTYVRVRLGVGEAKPPASQRMWACARVVPLLCTGTGPQETRLAASEIRSRAYGLRLRAPCAHGTATCILASFSPFPPSRPSVREASSMASALLSGPPLHPRLGVYVHVTVFTARRSQQHKARVCMFVLDCPEQMTQTSSTMKPCGSPHRHKKTGLSKKYYFSRREVSL